MAGFQAAFRHAAGRLPIRSPHSSASCPRNHSGNLPPCWPASFHEPLKGWREGRLAGLPDMVLEGSTARFRIGFTAARCGKHRTCRTCRNGSGSGSAEAPLLLILLGRCLTSCVLWLILRCCIPAIGWRVQAPGSSLEGKSSSRLGGGKLILWSEDSSRQSIRTARSRPIDA